VRHADTKRRHAEIRRRHAPKGVRHAARDVPILAAVVALVTAEPHGNSVVRVLVADDQTVVREGLVILLGLSPGVEVVAAAADGDEAASWRVSMALTWC
jgi:hypothetical protein